MNTFHAPRCQEHYGPAPNSPIKTPDYTPEWDDRWQVLCDRLISLAVKRGGLVTLDGTDLVLHAPARGGSCVRVLRGFEPGRGAVFADLFRGDVHWTMSDEDECPTLEKTVAAIIAGRVELEAHELTIIVSDADGMEDQAPQYSGTRKLTAWGEKD